MRTTLRVAVCTVMLAVTLAPVQPASAGRKGVETIAALDPSLTAGRGATVPFVEQEAENAFTTGEIIGPDRRAYTLPSEASGRKAVRLDSPGEFLEFTLTRPANALNVRYAIPDAPPAAGSPDRSTSTSTASGATGSR